MILTLTTLASLNQLSLECSCTHKKYTPVANLGGKRGGGERERKTEWGEKKRENSEREGQRETEKDRDRPANRRNFNGRNHVTY